MGCLFLKSRLPWKCEMLAIWCFCRLLKQTKIHTDCFSSCFQLKLPPHPPVLTFTSLHLREAKHINSCGLGWNLLPLMPVLPRAAFWWLWEGFRQYVGFGSDTPLVFVKQRKGADLLLVLRIITFNCLRKWTSHWFIVLRTELIILFFEPTCRTLFYI